MSLAGLPPVVVPEIANVCVAASSSATKNDGSEGVVMCDPVIAALAAGATTRPPRTSAPRRAAPAALLILVTSTEPSRSALLRAAGVRSAVAARVAAAGTDHPAAAAGALDGVLPRVEESRLAGRRRLGRLHGRGRLSVRVPLGHPRLHLGREDPRLLLLLGREEPLAEPAEDVVDDRLRRPDVGVVRQSARLEAHVAELRDVDLGRYAVLEAHRDGEAERVHQAGHRRPVLRDVDEDVAGAAVVVEADVDVALVVADLELAADLGAVERQALALVHLDGRRRDGGLAVLAGARERLLDLAVVAVDRDRLDAELPRVDVEVHHVLDRGLFRHVHRLRDRAGNEGLDGTHHPDVAEVVDGPFADGAVEDREMLRLHVRGADDAIPLVDEGDDLLDLTRRVAETLERHRNRLVDDRDLAAADELLRLDEREVGLDAGGV